MVNMQLQVDVDEAARIIGVLFTNCFEFKLDHIEVLNILFQCS